MKRKKKPLITCKHCGASVIEGSEKCSACGNPMNTENAESENEKPKKKKNLKTILIAIIASVLGLAVIVTGIVLPFALSDAYTKDENVNPYAEMKLSNGMTIRYEIWEKDCPIASTNFIYLANIGYFDGTVIYDNQNGWVRFGGWKADSTHRGDSDTDFLEKIDRTYEDRDYSKNKFGYRLKADSGDKANYHTVGTLRFCYERSATEFQVVASDDFSDTIPNDDKGEWKTSAFGMAADYESIENIKAIAALSRDDNGEKFKHDYYRAPLDKDGLIKVVSVKVHKKLESKWKNFDFMDYMLGSDGSTRRKSWTYSSQKKTGEN